jgi:hypothetical protein
MNESIDDFYTAKHARLTRIAAIANIIAWIVLIVYIVSIWGTIVQEQYMCQFTNAFQTNTFQNSNNCSSFLTDMFSHNILYFASFIVELASIFLRGIVFWLLLKGISLGLYMIVETDLNYKEKSQGGSDE